MKQIKAIKSKKDIQTYLQNFWFNAQDQIYISNRISSEYKSMPEFREDLLDVLLEQFEWNTYKLEELPDIFFKKDNKWLYDMYNRYFDEKIAKLNAENWEDLYTQEYILLNHKKNYKEGMIQIMRDWRTKNNDYKDIQKYITKYIMNPDLFWYPKNYTYLHNEDAANLYTSWFLTEDAMADFIDSWWSYINDHK